MRRWSQTRRAGASRSRRALRLQGDGASTRRAVLGPRCRDSSSAHPTTRASHPTIWSIASADASALPRREVTRTHMSDFVQLQFRENAVERRLAPPKRRVKRQVLGDRQVTLQCFEVTAVSDLGAVFGDELADGDVLPGRRCRDVGGARPAKIRNNVVFPEPFGPTSRASCVGPRSKCSCSNRQRSPRHTASSRPRNSTRSVMNRRPNPWSARIVPDAVVFATDARRRLSF